MSTKSKININHIARLASLPLTPQEITKYEKQLGAILEYVQLMESLETNNVQGTFNVSKNTKNTRIDKVNKGLTQDSALVNSKDKKDGYIVTKGVFENE